MIHRRSGAIPTRDVDRLQVQARLPSPVELERLEGSLVHLEASYPGFLDWFRGKVVPDLGRTRIILSSWEGDRPTGLVVAKSEAAERKLCTIWTAVDRRGEGIATSLVIDAMRWLKDDRPLVTVPDHRMPEFDILFRRLGFVRTQILADRYGPGRTEHVFNGVLMPWRARR